MMLALKRVAVSSLALALFAGAVPGQAVAAVAPSAQTILKQSFANLTNAPSYDMSGSLSVTLPSSVAGLETAEAAPYLVNGKEFRSYFTGSFDKAQKSYQFAATTYNAATGESPRIEIVGTEDGVVNFRVGGLSLRSSQSAEAAAAARYIDTWIRFDRTSIPAAAMMNPLLLPVVGTQSTQVYPISADQPVVSSATLSGGQLSAAEEQKMREMEMKIRKAFWSRNVVAVRRLADAKDHTGASAYHLGLKLNAVGARLFALDVAKIVGTKLSVSDTKELNKIFTKLPIFSGDVIVSKKTMVPELLAFSVSGFEPKASDDAKVSLRMTFEHVGSGRAITMPTGAISIEDVMKQLDNPHSPSSTPALSVEQARYVAVTTVSCQNLGGVSTSVPGLYNDTSRTWWFDIARSSSTPQGCFPACVVDEHTGAASVNARCTGAL